MYELIAYTDFSKLTQLFYSKEEAIARAMELEKGGWSTQILEVR